MKMHKSITLKRLNSAYKRSMSSECENPGFCIECGKKAGGCDPDARGDRCRHCGNNAVYGAEELLLYCT